MLKITAFTKRAAVDWQARHPATNKLSDLQLDRWAATPDDEIVAVAAIKDETIVGRIWVLPCNLLVRGDIVRARASGDLYVREDFRPQGIGPRLKMEILKLGRPQIVGGVSGKMGQIYERWRAYVRVDASPVYQLPLATAPMLAFARYQHYRRTRDSGPQPLKSKVESVLGLTSARASAAFTPGLSATGIPAREALGELDRILRTTRYPVQLPWNQETIASGLLAHSPRYKAWILKVSGQLYLTSMYLRERSIRSLRGRYLTISEGHLNEFFPPVEDKVTARQLILSAARHASADGIRALQIYALTPAIDQACRDLRLTNLFHKTVYIAPNDADREVADVLNDPSNWWCRGINEVQFVETLSSRRLTEK